MTRFNFVHSPQEGQGNFGITREQEGMIFKIIVDTVTESLDTMVKEKHSDNMMSIRIAISRFEIAQAVAEGIDFELTPEVAFYVGSTIEVILADRDAHISYIISKLGIDPDDLTELFKGE
jgi:hypothetical protein